MILTLTSKMLLAQTGIDNSAHEIAASIDTLKKKLEMAFIFQTDERSHGVVYFRKSL